MDAVGEGLRPIFWRLDDWLPGSDDGLGERLVAPVGRSARSSSGEDSSGGWTFARSLPSSGAFPTPT